MLRLFLKYKFEYQLFISKKSYFKLKKVCFIGKIIISKKKIV